MAAQQLLALVNTALLLDRMVLPTYYTVLKPNNISTAIRGGKSIAEKVGNAGEEICESRGGKVRGTIRESATRFSI